MKRTILLLPLLLLSAILFVSCGTKKDEVSLQKLNGSGWVLTHTDGIRLEGDYAEQTIFFDVLRSQVGGKAACNSYGGELSVNNNGRMEIKHLTSTRMACPDRMMEERMFFAYLEGAKAFRIKGNVLKIYATSDASGQPSLTLKRL